MAEPYRHRIRVRYGEVDMQRVVFNAHYLAYCDDAIEQWHRVIGIDGAALGWDFMLKRAVIEWQGSAGVNDELVIAVAVGRWGNTSFDVEFVGTSGDRPIFTATITYVGVHHGTTETMAPPPAVKEAMGAPPP